MGQGEEVRTLEGHVTEGKVSKGDVATPQCHWQHLLQIAHLEDRPRG